MAKKWRKDREKPRLVWREAEETMTLEGENVLTFRLIWPQLEGAGLGGRWISRYYARLAEDWRRRWRREVYWKACIQLAQRRAAAQPFTPWKGELRGEEVLWRDGVLSLRLDRLGEPGGRQSEPGAVGGRVEGAGGRALSPGGVAGETPGPEKAPGRPDHCPGGAAPERRGPGSPTGTGGKKCEKTSPGGTPVSPGRGSSWPSPRAP